MIAKVIISWVGFILSCSLSLPSLTVNGHHMAIDSLRIATNVCVGYSDDYQANDQPAGSSILPEQV